MGNYSAISDLGNEIIKFLRSNLCPEPVQNPESILLCHPFEKGDYLLGIHLYDIQPDGNYNQLDMVNVDGRVMRFPPMSLCLFYMFTVNSQANISSKSIDEQRILGRVMQLLYDNPVFEIPQIKPGAEASCETVYLSPNMLTFEEKSRLWSSSGAGNASKLALYYRASPVLIDSTRTTEPGRVVSIDLNLHQKE